MIVHTSATYRTKFLGIIGIDRLPVTGPAESRIGARRERGRTMTTLRRLSHWDAGRAATSSASSSAALSLVEVGRTRCRVELPSLSEAGEGADQAGWRNPGRAAISLIAWMAWLILAGSILIEAASRLRGHRTTPRAAWSALPLLARRPGSPTALLLFAASPSRPATQRPGSPTRGHRGLQPRPRPRPTPSHRGVRADGRWKPRQGRNRPLPGAERGLAVVDRP